VREGNDEFDLTKYLCLYFEGILIRRKILRHGAGGFTSAPKGGVLPILIAHRNPSPSTELEKLGSNGKHASHYTTEDN